MSNTVSTSDFFLSYSNRDKAKMKLLDKALRSRKAKVSIDEYDIMGGDNWIKKIHNLLQNSRICVALLSDNTRTAKVQPSEIFHFQALQSQNPNFYRLIPVFLSNTTNPPDIAGLDSLSSFFEKDGGLEKVADKLMETRKQMDDYADKTLRSISVVDELARVWLNQGNRFGARFRLDGDSVILSQGDYVHHKIRRDEFEKKLTKTEKSQVDHVEEKMNELLKEWKKADLDVANEDAGVKADKFASKLGESVKDLLDILVNAGFQLEDHYENIRNVVASYERRKNNSQDN